MPKPTPAQLARNRAAILARWRDPDDPERVAAEGVLTRLTADSHIEALVAGWPALTDAQRARLALLLDGDGGET